MISSRCGRAHRLVRFFWMAAGGARNAQLVRRKVPPHRVESRRVGDCGERVAARYLRKQGLEVITRNLRYGRGEIDLVAREGETLVFVEVKSRVTREGDEWTGLEKLDHSKRTALRRACNACCKSLPEPIDSYRVDAVAVEFRRRRYWGRRVEDVRWYPAIIDL